VDKERDKERHDEELAKAGWEPDGTFSEHLAIGHAGDLYVIVPAWVGGIIGSRVFELYDVQTNLSYWVREIPTPQEAAELLRKYGGPPEEERGNSNRNLESE
jgi:hypothetical protein